MGGWGDTNIRENESLVTGSVVDLKWPLEFSIRVLGSLHFFHGGSRESVLWILDLIVESVPSLQYILLT